MTAAAKALTTREALIACMAEVGAVGKDRRIEQGPAKYAYRSIESMLSKIQPAFVNHGVLCVPRILAAEYRDGTTRNGGSTREATLTVEFTFHGPDGSTLVASTIGEATDTSDKASNKAMTAAFKYALLMVLAIPTDEHDDQDAERHERGPQQPVQLPNPEARAKNWFLDLIGRDNAKEAADIWATVVEGEWDEALRSELEAAAAEFHASRAPFDGGDAA